MKMKNYIQALSTFIVIMILGTVCKGQDYNDIGRTKDQEFSILKFNGYKVVKLHTNDEGFETFEAKKAGATAQFENIIKIDKKTGLVACVVWNFDHKNYNLIRSLLTDMNPTDSTHSQLENKFGKAQLTFDPDHDESGMIVWKKKSF